MPTAESTQPSKKPIRPTLFHRVVNPNMERGVQNHLRSMHSPVYARLARALEARVPADATFGVFREAAAVDVAAMAVAAQEPFSPTDKA